MLQCAVAWFDTYRSKILESDQLQGAESVTNVRFDGLSAHSVVTDGPFLEGKAGIGATCTLTSPTWTRPCAWPGPGRAAAPWRSDHR
jgi:hypothetical protein